MGGNAYTQIGIAPLYGFSVGTKGVSRVVYDGTYNTVYYDDVYQYMASYDSSYNNLPITLFSLGYFVDTPYVNTTYNTYGLMYYAKIYDNTDTLVRDFVPVRRNSDGVLGMCDMVTGNFFTNSGTGEFVAGPAICDAGYWDNNGTCTRCPNGYYCPGDGSMIQCPANTHTPQEISELSGADLESSTNGWYVSSRYHTDYPDNISECNIAFDAGHIEGCTFYQVLYRWSVNTQNYEAFVGPRYFRGADNGYYLFNGTGYNYLGCTSCTNQIPLNSHYSGPGTPDVGNCPWACDSGYGQTSNNTCEQLCTAGVTGLHTSTGLVFNLYANKQTSPAIHVMPDGTNTVCYTSLAPGAANNAVNVEYNGATYHSID